MAREAIFIGYRRDDTADVAGRIYDAMAQRFGRQRIFKDVDNIGPGVDFGEYIKTVLPRCSVALVLIGPHWFDAKDEYGRRRIDDEHDWVRVEIETALATPGLLVIPVLVNGARLPRGEDVPASLHPLLRRNAAVIRRDPDFHDDVERLATALRATINTGVLDLSKVGDSGARSSTQKGQGGARITGILAGIALLVAIGYGVWRGLPQQIVSPPPSVTTAQAPPSATPSRAETAVLEPIVSESARPAPPASTAAPNVRYGFVIYDIYFDEDSRDLDAAASDAIGNIARVALSKGAVKIELLGLDDTLRDPATATRLAEARAKVVADALVAAGVPATLLKLEWKPTSSGRRGTAFRRVQITSTFRL